MEAYRSKFGRRYDRQFNNAVGTGSKWADAKRGSGLPPVMVRGVHQNNRVVLKVAIVTRPPYSVHRGLSFITAQRAELRKPQLQPKKET
jgi:hypothetical protein